MSVNWSKRWSLFFPRSRKRSSSRRSHTRLCSGKRTTLAIEYLEERALLSANPIGPQFLVAPTLGVPEHTAPVAILDSQGDFATAWRDMAQNGTFVVKVQVFKPDGTAIVTPLEVSTGAGNGNQLAPSIASDGNDDFVVAWQGEDLKNSGYNIYYQRESFDPSTDTIEPPSEQTSPLQVNSLFTTNPTLTQNSLGVETAPSVAMDAKGNFVIAWQSKDLNNQSLGSDIYAKQGSFSGGLQSGNEFLVSSTTTGDREAGKQTAPTVSMAHTGENSAFLIAWQGPAPSVAGSAGEEGSSEIFAKLYNSDGELNSGEIQVNTASNSDLAAPAAAMEMDNKGNGQFVIVWQGEGQKGSGSDVFGRRFTFSTTAGNPPAVDQSQPQFTVNETIPQPQRAPSVGMDAYGNFLVTWQSSHQDGYSWGLYGRYYNHVNQPGNPDTDTPEFLVNDLIQEGPQTAPALSMLPDGQTVVTWYGHQVNGPGEAGMGGHPLGVHARVFTINDKGVTLGDNLVNPPGSLHEFLLTLVTSPEDQPPAATMDANGDFVVVWQSWEDTGDLSGLGVYAQRYSANGTASGGPVLVNPFSPGIQGTFAAGSQSRPSVAMDANGDFVVVWVTQDPDGVETGIRGRYFNAAANQWGPEFDIVTDSTSTPTNPSIAMDTRGDFVVVWQSFDQEPLTTGQSPSWGIFGQRYKIDPNSADGVSTVGGIFPVNTTTENDQVAPVVAMNASGQFVVSWVGYNNVTESSGDSENGSEKSVYARWFNAKGQAANPEFKVSTYDAGAQESPAIAIANNGDFVVAWQSINQEKNQQGSGTSWGVYYRQFHPDGSSPQIQEELVNVTTLGTQRFASVGMDQNTGNFVIAWQSMNLESEKDQTSWSVFSRQYTYNKNGSSPVTGEVRVNTWDKGPQILPAIAENAQGNFGIFWVGQSVGPNGKTVENGVTGHLYEASSNGGGGTQTTPPKTSACTTFPHSLLIQLAINMQLLPYFRTPQAHREVERMFWFLYFVNANQSQQQTNDLVWQEFGLTWNLVLAGENLSTLANNPQTISIACDLIHNPMYNTLTGWWMTNLEMIGLMGI